MMADSAANFEHIAGFAGEAGKRVEPETETEAGRAEKTKPAAESAEPVEKD
ncbi:hypothetical protein [Bifidobacterium sp. ESL0745]|uniref:hypothetical protein n=1 Tax=Bifidobacterium sp. ESL0745 TaxID=2983226 RepID=UPI0023F815FF|nr:hypothetical protein [Bifidobacterium sp. ESL0745]MDF7665633.1 hypothetical protein [Bifidobacterium sp. ESL0745]